MNPVSYILSSSRLTISNSFWTFLAVQALTCQYPPPKKSCLFLIISLPRDRVAPNMPKVHKKQKGRAEIKAEFLGQGILIFAMSLEPLNSVTLST